MNEIHSGLNDLVPAPSRLRLAWPIPVVILVRLVGRRCYQCRGRMHYEATACPRCGTLVPERQR